MVLKLTFSDRLAYARNGGFRTAALSLPFKALRDCLTPSQRWCPEEDSNLHAHTGTST